MSARKVVKPRRRTEDLITENVGDELLVYKLDEHKALRINAVAARVWQRCDGERSIAGIARDLAAETGEPIQEELVAYTVARLSKAKLLDPANGEMAAPLSRRQLLGRLGIAAGALPVIFSLTAPRAFAQGSPVCAPMDLCGTAGFPCGTPCTTSTSSDPQSCVKVCDKGVGGMFMCVAAPVVC